MSTKKYIILCIIFLIVMPCKLILGQDIENNTEVQSELDIKYDSVLAKAASSLTASAYQKSIDYYKEASALKPGETYPYKMLKYVEDLAEKQKRSDDLTRKTQIKTALMRANQAIGNRNWDSAKVFLNKMLALHPEKTDEEYAKAKIEAIDSELQRIALRTPAKVAPPVVILPRNRREARAQRKLAERNAILAAASNKAIEQRQIQAQTDARLLGAAKNKKSAATSGTSTSVANANKISYQLLEHFKEDFKDASNVNWTTNSEFAEADFVQDDEKVVAFYDLNNALVGTSRYISINQLPRETKKILETKYPQYHIKEVMRYEGAEEIAYYISTEDDKEKVVFKLSGTKDISVFSRELSGRNAASIAGLNKELPNKPIQTPLPGNKMASAIGSPKTTVMQQKPVQTLSPGKSEAIASAKETGQKPIQVPLPEKRVASTIDSPKTKEIQQKPIQTTAKTNSQPIVASSAKDFNKAIQQKPIQPPATTTASIALPTAAKQVPQRPGERPASAKSEVISPAPNQIQQAPSTTKNRAVTALPSAKETQQKPVQAPPTANAAAYPLTKVIQKKPAPVELPNDDITTTSANEIPQKTADGHQVNLSDSSDYVKLICQDISFIGSNAYIKVLIQNYSPTTEFTTDTLHVSIKKNNGSIKQLDQRFISNFPVIMPLKESVLVSFADAAMNVDPDDIFILEMKDRMKKTKLTVQVPWKLYNQQKSF